ncbi:DUF1997 domain containing protein [Nitzschia inconspicua]|uniref:DUF1997 domain containing protein n=1 Tax=Nitzschia inconspicua TaxID=303405 RepID=A0A9K3LMN9_9STRA|nr:DUF1997 domain containing protein [Nitzschia inconspicua]
MRSSLPTNNNMMFLVHCTVFLFFGLGNSSEAFLRNRPFTRLPMYPYSVSSVKTISTTTTGLFAETVHQTPEQKTRRKELLKRDGTHFQLDRLSGTIEFGAAANLVTELESSQGTDDTRELIESWLTDDDGRGLAQSIWEEDLLTDLGNGVFRLQTMPLQFITLQLQPAVDIQMWTQPSGKNKAGRLLPPIFKMQSLTFEPNLQILPGMSVTAQSLGLVVEVVGDLRPTPDGKGVIGKICFQSTGVLPPPLRIVPESALQLAVDTINDAVVSFAISSFQKGARQKYLEYRTKHVAKMLEKQALS